MADISSTSPATGSDDAAAASAGSDRHMRAVVLTADGGVEALEVRDVPRPEPEAGQVRVHLSHAALNHLDVWIRKGLPSVPKPRIMGGDGTGVVDAVGHGVDESLVGTRVLIDPSITCTRCPACMRGDSVLCDHFEVLGEHRSGTQAEYVVVPERNVHEAPGHLSGAQAAALPLVFATAWRMVRTRAAVQPGEHMLVWGASSGVGTAAIQLASRMGVRVIATSRSDEKLRVCRELGAVHVINSERDDVVAAARELTGGRGPEVVFDHLGQVSWEPSFKLLAKGGRYVTCGATTGPNPKALITRIFWKQLTVLGSTMASSADFADMLRFVDQQEIVPRVDRSFALRDVRDAHEYLESARQVGKVVLDIAG